MFVALVPPAEAVEDLDAFLDPRREAGPDLRWSAPEQVHVTLAFYADGRGAPRSTSSSSGWRARRPGARRSGRGSPAAGPSPNAARARVLWAGLDLDAPAATELDRLAAGARAAAARAGVVVDGQRFRAAPHLARLGRPSRGLALGAAARRLRRAGVDRRPGHAGRLPPRRGAAAPAPPRGGRRAAAGR